MTIKELLKSHSDLAKKYPLKLGIIYGVYGYSYLYAFKHCWDVADNLFNALIVWCVLGFGAFWVLMAPLYEAFILGDFDLMINVWLPVISYLILWKILSPILPFLFPNGEE
jgi:hypothetical protein